MTPMSDKPLDDPLRANKVDPSEIDARSRAVKLVSPIFRRLFATLFVVAGIILVVGGPEWPLDWARAFGLSLGLVNIIIAVLVIIAYNRVRVRLSPQDKVMNLLPTHILYLGLSHIVFIIAVMGQMADSWNEKINIFALPVALIAFSLSTFGLALMVIFQQAKESRVIDRRKEARDRASDTGR